MQLHMEDLKSKTQGHVLVVDDEEEMRNLCRDYLEAQGFRVTMFSGAKEAWQKLTEDSVFADGVDAVLSDVRMPGLGGLDFLYQLRQRFPQIPVVLMTAYGAGAESKKALKTGAYDYVGKPFHLSRLKSTIQAAVDSRRAS